jgi:hypothetical protein
LTVFSVQICCSFPVPNQQFLRTNNIGYAEVITVLGSIQLLNINEYQEYFLGGRGGRCLGLTTLPTSCAKCLEISELQIPGTLYGNFCSFYVYVAY